MTMSRRMRMIALLVCHVPPGKLVCVFIFSL
jgi:hypothetical protein